MYRCWIEISKKALVSNFKEFKRIVGDKKILSVLKSNAYGHGLESVAKILDKRGTDWFGVDSLPEAIAIRKIGIKKPILVMGYTPIFWIADAIKNDISITVYARETIKKIISLNSKNKAKIQIKLETGMNRQGIDEEELSSFLKLIDRNKIIVEGFYTHFADVKNPPDFKFTNLQLEKFRRAKEILLQNGLNINVFHTAATSAALLYPETYFDMVRIGIGLYGMWPADKVRTANSKNKKLKVRLSPVLSWKSIIGKIRKIKKGETVGYGRTWKAKRNSLVAVVPVGYFDGFDRGLSNSGRVLIKGKFAPIVGRVSMNMITVDITGIRNVKIEDEVALIGKSGKNEIRADELAERLGTISYEVVSRINPLLPRVIV